MNLNPIVVTQERPSLRLLIKVRSFMPMTTTVTESNQVSISPEIAREFHIHPGTRLDRAKAGAR